jgi:hypothetical protein
MRSNNLIAARQAAAGFGCPSALVDVTEYVAADKKPAQSRVPALPNSHRIEPKASKRKNRL